MGSYEDTCFVGAVDRIYTALPGVSPLDTL